MKVNKYTLLNRYWATYTKALDESRNHIQAPQDNSLYFSFLNYNFLTPGGYILG